MKQEAFRHVPYDIELEQALLGSMLVDNKLIDIVASELDPRHLYDPLHQRLIEMICYLQNEGTVTPLIVHSIMKADPGLVEVGGHAYLMGLAQAAPALPNVRDYVRIIKELAIRRELIALGEEMVNDAYDSPKDRPAREIADRIANGLIEVGGTQRAVITPWASALKSLQDIEDMQSGKPVPIIMTGFQSIDDELGGLRGGDFIVVPAHSGMGKSALMAQLSANTALAGIPTLVFSYEMTTQQWIDRIVTGIDFLTAPKPMWYSKVRNGKINTEEFSRYYEAAIRLQTIPLVVRDEDDLTMQQVTMIARAFKARFPGKTGIVLIDYIQIVDPGDTRGMSREQVVNKIARACKSLAKQLNWPVVAGSQMNENADNRTKEEKRPQAGDVRESKGIKNEADMMLSPWREAYLLENRKPLGAPLDGADWLKWKADMKLVRYRMDLLTLKNRHGRRPDFELYADMGANGIVDAKPVAQFTSREVQENEDTQGLLI